MPSKKKRTSILLDVSDRCFRRGGGSALAYPGFKFPRETRRWTRAEGPPHYDDSLGGPAHNFREVQEGHPDRGVDAVDAYAAESREAGRDIGR